jgi:primosomal protein N'
MPFKKPSQQDFPGFAEQELAYRKKLHYPPPYYRLARLLFLCPSLELLRYRNGRVSDTRFNSNARTYSDGKVLFLGLLTALPLPDKQSIRYHINYQSSHHAPLLQQSIALIVNQVKLPASLKCKSMWIQWD